MPERIVEYLIGALLHLEGDVAGALADGERAALRVGAGR